MPIYEYQCEGCGHELEAIQKFSDPLLTECEKCGDSTLKKKMSLPSFALKGGGWYKDGYGAPSEKSNTTTKDSASTTSPSTETKASSANTDGAKDKTAAAPKTESKKSESTSKDTKSKSSSTAA